MGKAGTDSSRERREARAAAQRRARKRNRLLAGGGGLVISGSAGRHRGQPGQRGGRRRGVPPAPPRRRWWLRRRPRRQGAIAVGDASAPVRLEVYLDYMCPFCGRFERANGARARPAGRRRHGQAGAVPAVVPGQGLGGHPVLHPGRQRGRHRRRPGARQGPGVQRGAVRPPARRGQRRPVRRRDRRPGPRRRGAARTSIDAFTERIFEPWVAEVTDAAFAAGITGTPTVKINGEVFKGDLYTAGPLTAGHHRREGPVVTQTARPAARRCATPTPGSSAPCCSRPA